MLERNAAILNDIEKPGALGFETVTVVLADGVKRECQLVDGKLDPRDREKLKKCGCASEWTVEQVKSFRNNMLNPIADVAKMLKCLKECAVQICGVGIVEEHVSCYPDGSPVKQINHKTVNSFCRVVQTYRSLLDSKFVGPYTNHQSAVSMGFGYGTSFERDMESGELAELSYLKNACEGGRRKLVGKRTYAKNTVSALDKTVDSNALADEEERRNRFATRGKSQNMITAPPRDPPGAAPNNAGSSRYVNNPALNDLRDLLIDSN